MDFGDPDHSKTGQNSFFSTFQEKGLIIILRPKWGKLGEKWACGIIYKSKYAKNEIRVPPLNDKIMRKLTPVCAIIYLFTAGETAKDGAGERTTAKRCWYGDDAKRKRSRTFQSNEIWICVINSIWVQFISCNCSYKYSS